MRLLKIYYIFCSTFAYSLLMLQSNVMISQNNKCNLKKVLLFIKLTIQVFIPSANAYTSAISSWNPVAPPLATIEMEKQNEWVKPIYYNRLLCVIVFYHQNQPTHSSVRNKVQLQHLSIYTWLWQNSNIIYSCSQ